MSEGIKENDSSIQTNIATQVEMAQQPIDLENVNQISGHHGAKLNELIDKYTVDIDGKGKGPCPFIASMGAAGLELIRNMAEEQKDPNSGPTMREIMEARKQKAAEASKPQDEPKKAPKSATQEPQTEHLQTPILERPEDRAVETIESPALVIPVVAEVQPATAPAEAINNAVRQEFEEQLHSEKSTEDLTPLVIEQISSIEPEVSVHLPSVSAEKPPEHNTELEPHDSQTEIAASELEIALTKVSELLTIVQSDESKPFQFTDPIEVADTQQTSHVALTETSSSDTEVINNPQPNAKEAPIDYKEMSESQQVEVDVTELIATQTMSVELTARLEALEPETSVAVENLLSVISEKVQELIERPEADNEAFDVALVKVEQEYEELLELLGIDYEEGAIERLIFQLKSIEAKPESTELAEYIDEGMHERKASDMRFLNALVDGIQKRLPVHEILGKIAVELGLAAAYNESITT
jgi:hypothetical protein